MKSLESTPIWRYLALLIVVLVVLVSGTWLTVKFTTEHLLYQNATRTAENWAQFLAPMSAISSRSSRRRPPCAARCRLRRKKARANC